MTIGVPDTPFSLMEGIGGEIVFLQDLISEKTEVRFPGYELLF